MAARQTHPIWEDAPDGCASGYMCPKCSNRCNLIQLFQVLHCHVAGHVRREDKVPSFPFLLVRLLCLTAMTNWTEFSTSGHRRFPGSRLCAAETTSRRTGGRLICSHQIIRHAKCIPNEGLPLCNGTPTCHQLEFEINWKIVFGF